MADYTEEQRGEKLSFEQKVALAKKRCVVGSKWRNRKSGIVAEVVEISGYGTALLRRPKMRDTYKWISALSWDYEFVDEVGPLAERKEG